MDEQMHDSQQMATVLNNAERSLRMPQAAFQILEIANAPESEFSDLADAIAIDASFAARILQLANSASYSRSGEVSDLMSAVARVGYREVADLAVLLSLSQSFSELETELLRSTSFWNHSLSTGLLARAKAETLGIQDQGIFAAGLLHDLGLLLEFGFLGDEMMEVLDASITSTDINLVLAEEQVLGYNHARLGAELCRRWALPTLITSVVEFHHEPEKAIEFRDLVVLVSWANDVETAGADLGDVEESLLNERLSALDGYCEAIPAGALRYDRPLLQSVQRKADGMVARLFS